MLGTHYLTGEVAKIVGGQCIGDGAAAIYNVVFDSRLATGKEDELFLALKGTHNGHDFLGDAYSKGVRLFMVEPRGVTKLLVNATYIVVDNVLAALQLWAATHRRRFRPEVIGITGSNGKTVVKEWLAELLAPEFSIVRSQKSYNSQLGVPLAVLQIGPLHTLALIEAGISTAGEMGRLNNIIAPTVGIFTTLGSAHDAGFTGRDEKLSEKLKLFDGCGMVVINEKYATAPGTGKKNYTLGESEAATVVITETANAPAGTTRVHVQTAATGFDATLPFTTDALVENCKTCIAMMCALGYDAGTIVSRIASLKPLDMRLKIIKGTGGCDVIDDSYSADLYSLKLAAEFVNRQFGNRVRRAIISCIEQAGLDDDMLYSKVGQIMGRNGFTKIVTVGVPAGIAQKYLPGKVEAYDSTDALLERISQGAYANEAILVKGGRKYGFEQVTALLARKNHSTMLTINLNALANNLTLYKKLVGPATGIMVMVKAFAYGSGSYEVAAALVAAGANYLAVAYLDEGVALREAGIVVPIMVMSPASNDLPKMKDFNLEPEIYSIEMLKLAARLAEEGACPPIHLKVDTGMHRLGLDEADIGLAAGIISQSPELRVASIFSHLAAAENENADLFTLQQIAEFTRMAMAIEKAAGHSVIKHISNTAGIERWPQARFDMVRVGIGVYGYGNLPGMQQQNVLTLTTTVTQVRKVAAGQAVGYGRNAILQHDAEIATVKIGYADGYDRRLGNGKMYMLAKGKRAYTVGNICMDMAMLDVTGLNVKPDDEVTVLGEDPDANTLAAVAGTISYEILTGITERVKRIYTYE